MGDVIGGNGDVIAIVPLQCIFLNNIARVPAENKETNDLRLYKREYNIGYKSDKS